MTKINLHPHFFTAKERLFIQDGELSASLWCYDSGVAALRLENSLGAIIILPFQGQQIWSANFLGRELTMKSMFREPKATQTYLETYGGFLVHCGITAMGVPDVMDNHPLHGELPNAPYKQAYLIIDEDEGGRYIALGGTYQHTVAFSHNILVEPLVKLYEGSSLLDVSMKATNLKQSEMELMYLAHANFRPVDNAEIIYSATPSPETVRVRKSIPSHVMPKAGYREFLEELAQYPEKHHVLEPDLAFDPEVVFNITYQADEVGWAHSLQKHPDGSYDYIAHRPEELDIGVRWICRTPDQDALGLILPATAEPEGYTAEKAKGNLKILPAQGVWQCHMRMGALEKAEGQALEKKIAQLKI